MRFRLISFACCGAAIIAGCAHTAAPSPDRQARISLSHGSLEAHDIRLTGSRLEASGDVRLHFDDGRTLMTPFLSQDLHTGVIMSDSAYSVRLDGHDAQSGVGFRTDTSMTRWRCLSRCAGAPVSLVPTR
jgi:hypothetical protein